MRNRDRQRHRADHGDRQRVVLQPLPAQQLEAEPAQHHDQRRGEHHEHGYPALQALRDMSEHHAEERGDHAHEERRHKDFTPALVALFQPVHAAQQPLAQKRRQ